MATAEDIQWIHDSLDDAACVTVVIGKDRDGVLEAFSADRSAIPVGEAEGYQLDVDDVDAGSSTPPPTRWRTSRGAAG